MRGAQRPGVQTPGVQTLGAQATTLQRTSELDASRECGLRERVRDTRVPTCAPRAARRATTGIAHRRIPTTSLPLLRIGSKIV